MSNQSRIIQKSSEIAMKEFLDSFSGQAKINKEKNKNKLDEFLKRAKYVEK